MTTRRPMPMVFPGKEWTEAAPESQGLDSARLKAAVDYLGDQLYDYGGAGSVAIVRNGVLIWKGLEVDVTYQIYSATKSFTSTALGLLIDDGKAKLTTPAKDFEPRLAELYPKVTLRHFATMTSGYDAVGGGYEPDAEGRMDGERRPEAPPAAPIFAPGTRFRYWDDAMTQFGHVLTLAAGEPLDRLIKRRITDPIGLTKWTWGAVIQQSGPALDWPGGIVTTARELARFGHLFLNGGNWDGKQLISARWVRQATSVQVPNTIPNDNLPRSRGSGIYGYNWWVNGIKPTGIRLWPDAPPKTYYANGLHSNVCIVVPEWNMVITRTNGWGGKNVGNTPENIDEIWSGFFARLARAVDGGAPARTGSRSPARSVAPRAYRWQPGDFPFRSETDHPNPFAVSFSATVAGPGGMSFESLGFYDGDGTWKVRVAPTVEGRWSLTTHSDDPALDGRRLTFACLPNRSRSVHGGLRVDREHPHHFVFEDGTRYFLMGYECDWLWALDMGDPALPRLNRFLDKLAAHGFNYVILNAYAHDTGWRRGKTGDDDFGPPPKYAWHGTNEKPDYGRLNLAYWQHYDRVLEALHRRGMVAHMMVKVYNKMVHWPAKGSAEDDRYFRWLVARYAAYPNVVWDFSKEAHYEEDRQYKLGRLALIRRHDPYRRLMTVHDDDAAYEGGAYDGVLDYRADQHHDGWHAMILRQRDRHRWPAVNVEFGYEHGPAGPEDMTYGVVQPPEEVCRRAWEICMAGGYGAYYYTYTAWDVIRPDDTPPGYAYFQRLRAFFERTRYWLLQPADTLVSEGYCLADPGREYVVFLNRARAFTLKLDGVEGALPAEWYQPLTGERRDAGRLRAGVVPLEPPAEWADGPAALHIGGME